MIVTGIIKVEEGDNVSAAERIIIALDLDEGRALELAQALQGQALWMKVGMTLYYAAGPQIVAKLRALGFKVFLDLKLFDIPHQIEGAARAAAASGADFVSVHASGGAEMLRAAAAGLGEKALGLGITVLTSFNQVTLAEVGVERPLVEQVQALAALALDNGMRGVVTSPKEATLLRRQLGPDALIVTPGVRPAGAQKGDQKRVATPAEAFAAGASHIVVGRPITAAGDPLQAFSEICASL
ncbi:MAG: orotidine-5'-phosphate decarboxylase [Coriobacteriales bacterium]|nr:orotidine-5'-phosphate decarboxylase [Coriobacteriales bacterium]